MGGGGGGNEVLPSPKWENLTLSLILVAATTPLQEVEHSLWVQWKTLKVAQKLKSKEPT